MHAVTHIVLFNSTKARLISDSENVLPTHIEIMAAKYAWPLLLFPRDIPNNREHSGLSVFLFCFFFLRESHIENGVELGVHRVEYGDSILNSLLRCSTAQK